MARQALFSLLAVLALASGPVSAATTTSGQPPRTPAATDVATPPLTALLHREMALAALGRARVSGGNGDARRALLHALEAERLGGAGALDPDALGWLAVGLPSPRPAADREAELPGRHSQAELGNDGKFRLFRTGIYWCALT